MDFRDDKDWDAEHFGMCWKNSFGWKQDLHTSHKSSVAMVDFYGRKLLKKKLRGVKTAVDWVLSVA